VIWQILLWLHGFGSNLDTVGEFRRSRWSFPAVRFHLFG